MRKLTFTINYVYKSKEVLQSKSFKVECVRDAFNRFFDAVDVLRMLPNTEIVEVHLSRHHAGNERTIAIGYPCKDCKVWDYDFYNYCPTPLMY